MSEEQKRQQSGDKIFSKIDSQISSSFDLSARLDTIEEKVFDYLSEKIKNVTNWDELKAYRYPNSHKVNVTSAESIKRWQEIRVKMKQRGKLNEFVTTAENILYCIQVIKEQLNSDAPNWETIACESISLGRHYERFSRGTKRKPENKDHWKMAKAFVIDHWTKTNNAEDTEELRKKVWDYLMENDEYSKVKTLKDQPGIKSASFFQTLPGKINQWRTEFLNKRNGLL